METAIKTKEKFDANKYSFEEGVKKVQKASEKANFKVGDKPITSKDPDAIRVAKLLEVTNVPDGFKKWQLPIIMDCSTQLFISCGLPDVEVPEHSHDEGPGMRFIMTGSIHYKDQELTAGDWMYIPAGAKYSLKIGKLGATMCYCHCCCCG